VLQVLPVRTRAQIADFIALPHRIHGGPESRWVAPPDLYVRSLMGPVRAEDRRFLLAVDDGEVVGRMGVKKHGEALHFGFFECLAGRADGAAALAAEAHRLAPELPMRGPFQFTLEDPFTGLLVEGFEEPPYFLMAYNPPFYPSLLEAAGFHPIKALHAYQIGIDSVRYELMRSRADRARARGVTVRHMARGQVRREVRAIAAIFEDALSDNWGFEPFNERTLDDLEMLARFVPERWGVMIAQRGGVDVGCLIVIPNFNMLLHDLGGRLRPSILWRYLRRGRIIDTYRGYALGVRRDHQADEIAALLIDHLMRQGERTRWRTIEIGWVLEDNRRMIALARALGARRSKVYRILERPA
jgi:hypothetical protein